MRKEIQKVGLLVLLAMSALMSGFAQDDAQFTFFPWVTSYYNAGGIGEQHNTLCFTADYSNKYLGWGDLSTTAINNDTAQRTAPQDFLFSIESYLRKLHGSIGVTLVHDQIGYYKNTGVKLGYAYKLRLGGGHLGIGAQVSLYNQAINGTWITTQQGDPTLEQPSVCCTRPTSGMWVPAGRRWPRCSTRIRRCGYQASTVRAVPRSSISTAGTTG